MWAVVCENGDFLHLRLNNWETVQHRWVHAAMGLANWQGFNCLSIHATCFVIIAGASPGETKMWAAVRENSDFFVLAQLTNVSDGQTDGRTDGRTYRDRVTAYTAFMHSIAR